MIVVEHQTSVHVHHRAYIPIAAGESLAPTQLLALLENATGPVIVSVYRHAAHPTISPARGEPKAPTAPIHGERFPLSGVMQAGGR